MNTPQYLDSGRDNANLQAYSSVNSVTPTAGATLVLIVGNEKTNGTAAGAVTPTCSWGAWVAQGSEPWLSDSSRLVSVFTMNNASAVSDVIDFAVAGTNNAGLEWYLWQIVGGDATPVTIDFAENVGTATSQVTNIVPLQNSGNVVVTMIINDENLTTGLAINIAGTGWIASAASANSGAPPTAYRGAHTAVGSAPSTELTATNTPNWNVFWMIASVEIQPKPSAALAGQADPAATSSAGLSTQITAAAAAAGQSDASAALTTVVQLAGSVGAASDTGAPALQGSSAALAAQVDAVSGVADIVLETGMTSEQVQAALGVSADLATQILAQAQADAAVSVSADLATGIRLAGQDTAPVLDASGTLTGVSAALQALVAAGADVTLAQLQTLISAQGTVGAQAGAIADLLTAIQLAGLVTAQESEGTTALTGISAALQAAAAAQSGIGAVHLEDAPRWSIYNVTRAQDITEWVRPLTGLKIKNNNFKQSATMSCRLIDFTDSLVINPEDEIEVFQDNVLIFRGYLRQRVRRDMNIASSPSYPGGKLRVWEISCQDTSTLPFDDVVDSGNRVVPESDSARISWLFTTFGTKGVSLGHVATVGGGTLPAVDYTGMTIGEALNSICKLTGALWYVDFDKDLHYFASESNPAPFNLSDTPDDVATLPYRNFNLPDDTIDYYTDVFVVGDGVSGWRSMVSVPYPRRKAVIKDSGIKTSADVTAAGDAFLALHGRPRQSGTLDVWHAGLRAGQSIHITNSMWDIDDDEFTIVSVETSISSAFTATFTITFGDQPIGLEALLNNVQTSLSSIQGDMLEQSAYIADLSVGGANLIVDSSFELGGTGWDFGPTWVVNTPGDAFNGTKVARLLLVGPGNETNYLRTGLIPVVRTEDYWFSYYSWLRARTAGQCQFVMEEYNGSGTLILTTLLESYSTLETISTRHSVEYGASATGTKRAFQPTTTHVRMRVQARTTPAMVWDVDGFQAERGNVVTAYAPAPQELNPSTVGTTQIADDAVTSPKIIAGAVVAGKVAADAISANEIQAGAIGATELQAGAVVAGKIAANAITATEIQAGTITGTKLAAATITGTNLAVDTITTRELTVGSVTFDEIALNTILNSNLATDAVDARVLQAGSVTANDITTGTLTGITITGVNISAGGAGNDGFRVLDGSGTELGKWTSFRMEVNGSAVFFGTLLAGNNLMVPHGSGIGSFPGAVGLGSLFVDDSSSPTRFYFYTTSGWHYAAATAGFLVPAEETMCPVCGNLLRPGDDLAGLADRFTDDGSLHGLWRHRTCTGPAQPGAAQLADTYWAAMTDGTIVDTLLERVRALRSALSLPVGKVVRGWKDVPEGDRIADASDPARAGRPKKTPLP